jgi:protein gp37
VPARVRFVSAEPLLGPLDLRPWMADLHWVISGGESGPKARPSSPSWFRDPRSQCELGGVAFHFKQWGDWAPDERNRSVGTACLSSA